MNINTWQAQFLGAYLIARKNGVDATRATLAPKRAAIMAQPGGQESLDAFDVGLGAADMGMNERDARAWAEKIDNTRKAG